MRDRDDVSGYILILVETILVEIYIEQEENMNTMKDTVIEI